MSKRYTVDETWELCLKMWKWIDWHVARNPQLSVNDLKDEWLDKQGLEEVHSTCFFCAYTVDACKRNHVDLSCVYCPIKKVDRFISCESHGHHYLNRPRLFYAELRRLNKIRLAKKTNAI